MIRSALDRAITEVSNEPDLEEADRPEMDEATKGEPGMVDIAATVLKKIGECRAFVADLTPVCEAPNGKKMPNSNVVFELGYAYAKPGQGAIIAIVNKAKYKPDDLPFDLRGKRVMSYKLADNATPAEKKSALDGLTRGLTDALRLIVTNARDVKAATTEIEGVEADPSNPSIWKGGRRFDFTIPYLNEDVVHIIDSHQRSFVRIIPAPWKVPNITEVASLANDLWPSTSGGTGSGNYGAVEFGYVKLWYAGKRDDGQYIAKNVAAFHEASGEWWFIDGSSVIEYQNETFFDPIKTFAEWQRSIRNANANLDRLGAPPLRKVIVGVVGTQNAMWAGRPEKKFRKPSMEHSAQNAQWTAVDEMVFLKDAYNIVRNGFAMEPLDQVKFDKLLDKLV
ncbi:hypothetical protein W911_16835 [Hyphomicrobium nitrativorans NL23]|uniref:Uncharacterized protein n=1 Tax=Hyphomicrobium nitrativorans NL23 TaxID=1029756 RepID=V5SKD9_9HYPH|nr:hypothetical protein W911_16835 [Hyphomicrobium nitrativorans NL23]